MGKKRKKTDIKTLESFIQRKDSGNAIKIASHCDIPGLVSFLMIENKEPSVYRQFQTGANLYLDDRGFFFDYIEPYGAVQEKLLLKSGFGETTSFPLITRIADGTCVLESEASVSPFEISERLNVSDISRFRELYNNYSNKNGVYSDRMSAELDAFGELARILRTDDVLAIYNPPYRCYNNVFFNSDSKFIYPLSKFMWAITLHRKSGKTILEKKPTHFSILLFD